MAHDRAARGEPGVDDALPGRIPPGDDDHYERAECAAAGRTLCRARVCAGGQRAPVASSGLVAAAIPGLCARERALGDAGALARLEGLAGLGANDPGFLGRAQRRAVADRAHLRLRRPRGRGVGCGDDGVLPALREAGLDDAGPGASGAIHRAIKRELRHSQQPGGAAAAADSAAGGADHSPRCECVAARPVRLPRVVAWPRAGADDQPRRVAGAGTRAGALAGGCGKRLVAPAGGAGRAGGVGRGGGGGRALFFPAQGAGAFFAS